MKLVLHPLPMTFTVCRLSTPVMLDPTKPFHFLSVTDEEISLLCPTAELPDQVTSRQDGWKGLRIEGQLDFSLIGILSALTKTLAENGIPVFAVSTFNTDYLFVPQNRFDQALDLFQEVGHSVS